MSNGNKTGTFSASKRKEYEDCQLEVIPFDSRDVVTASDDFGGIPFDWYNDDPEQN